MNQKSSGLRAAGWRFLLLGSGSAGGRAPRPLPGARGASCTSSAPVSRGPCGGDPPPIRSCRCSRRLPFSGSQDLHAGTEAAPRLLHVRSDSAARWRYVQSRAERPGPRVCCLSRRGVVLPGSRTSPVGKHKEDAFPCPGVRGTLGPTCLPAPSSERL